MKCITIWNNKIISASLIEIRFIKEGDVCIKVFNCGYKYPTQYWQVEHIKIYSESEVFEYSNIVFSINYESDYCYLE